MIKKLPQCSEISENFPIHINMLKSIYPGKCSENPVPENGENSPATAAWEWADGWMLKKPIPENAFSCMAYESKFWNNFPNKTLTCVFPDNCSNTKWFLP